MYIDFSDVRAGLTDSKYSNNSGNQNHFTQGRVPISLLPVSARSIGMPTGRPEAGAGETRKLDPGSDPSFLQEKPCPVVVNEEREPTPGSHR